MRFLLLIFTALMLFVPAAPSSAQNMPPESLVGFSETEKTGFAFYQLIKKEPPYIDWIQNRDDYIRGSPKQRMEIMDHEKLRLRDGFANFQVDREMILVKLPLNYTLIDNPDYHTDAAAQNRGLIKRLIITLPGDKAPYFPFQIGKFWVGVIPMGLDKSLTIDLSEEDYNALARGMTDDTNFKNKSVLTTVLLKPLQADATKPMMEGDMPVFLMMSDVASLSVYGLTNKLIWDWTARWYMNSKSQELMILHK